jgi:hypothetical protein
MIKLLALLTIITSQQTIAQVETLSVNQYFTSLKGLSNEKLVDHFVKTKDFGQCKIRKSLAPSSSCLYTITLKNNATLCFTNQNSLGIIGLSRPSTLPTGFTAAQPLSAYVGSIRASVINSTGAIGKFADFLRYSVLDPTKNSQHCSFSSTPGVSTFDLTAFNTSNTQFFQLNPNKPVICKTNIRSRKLWNSASCSYSQKDMFLPNPICQKIYNRLSKVNGVEVAPPAIGPLTSAIATELVNQVVSAEAVHAVDDAVSSVPAFEAIDTQLLVAREAETLDGTSFSCTGTPLAVALCENNIKMLKGAINQASSTTGLFVPSNVNFTLPSGWTAVTPTLPINNLVVSAYEATALALNEQAQNISISMNLDAVVAVSTNFVYRPLSPTCMPLLEAVAAAPASEM